MEIEKSRIQEIVKLHSEIIGHLRVSLDKAIMIGQLLTEQKESLKHGEFTPWIKANIPFTDRTARNYMRLYHERDRIKTETVSDLKCAYNLLAPPKEQEEPPEPRSIRDFSKEQLVTLIGNLNAIIGDKEHEIDSDPSGLMQRLRLAGKTDETDDELKTSILRIHLFQHLCCYRLLAWTRGLGQMPEGIRRYLSGFEEDNPGFLSEEPKPVCGECRNSYVLNPRKKIQ